jgi:hypothetical protein
MTKRKAVPSKDASLPEKRTLVSYKDVIHTFLLDGVDGVEKLERLSKYSLRKAIKALRTRERPCDDLDELYAKLYGARVGKYPSRTPEPGDVRTYAAVRFRDKLVVNRIYLSTLGNPERVAVTHLRDVITIKPVHGGGA